MEGGLGLLASGWSGLVGSALMALALTGVHVWDGSGAARTEGPWTIRIDHGRITALGPGTALARGAEEIRHVEATALPGLIDSHVHLTLDPSLMRPRDQLLLAPDVVDAAMAVRAESMVRAGITTARDLGAGAWRELRLRDRIAQGELIGPRLLCAGQPVTAPGGHCHFWGGEARGELGLRAVVDRQLAHGTDWVKVMATGGVFTPRTSPRRAQFTQAELALVVDRAREGGRHVAAHCHGTEGIENAVGGGVRTIEHCSFAGDRGFGTALESGVVDAIAERGAWVSPTVNAGWLRRIEKDGRATPFFERMSSVLKALVAAGVPLVASTDAGIPGVVHDRLAPALAALARYTDLPPASVLAAATSEAARALDLSHETGELRPGLAADIVVVPGDPLRDLAALEHPLTVIARGRVVRSAESEPGTRGPSS